MFSGIVETIGLIRKATLENDCLHLVIDAQQSFTDVKIGDSLSVNGVCLTVTAIQDQRLFNLTLVPETLRLTNLGELKEGSEVNLERSLKADGRNGGHYVQGHVDALGEILDIQADGKSALTVKTSIPEQLAKYIVNKGYITFDGMSLTVIEAAAQYFTVTLIPHTQDVTISKHYQKGSKVNLEVDILSKYVEKIVRATACTQL